MEKIAAKPYVAGQSPEAVEANNELKAEALRGMARTGLLGLGAGATLAALLGLPQLIRKPKIPSYPLQNEVELPYPQEVKKADSPSTAALASLEYPLLGSTIGAAHGAAVSEDKRQGALRGGTSGLFQGLGYMPGAIAGEIAGQKGLQAIRRYKMKQHESPDASRLYRISHRRIIGARRALPILGAMLGGMATGIPLSGPASRTAAKLVGPVEEKKADWAKTIADKALSATPGEPAPSALTPKWFRGDSHTSTSAIPWAIPGYMAAGLGGLLGGHSLVRQALKHHRKADLDKELQDAQQEYDEAMLSQYDPTKLRNLSGLKEAASTTLLDVCYDAASHLEKRGFLGLSVNNGLGRGAGLYLTLAGLLGLGSGVGTYKWLHGRSGEKTLQDALKRRAALRALQNPAELYVRPVPVQYVEDKSESKT